MMIREKEKRAPADPSTLGGRIRIAREAKGLSQAELGKVFGISREAVAQWESNTNAPTSDKIGRIAVETQVNIQWLWKHEGGMEGQQAQVPTLPADMAQQAQMAMGPLPVAGYAEGGPDGLLEWNGEIIDYIQRPAFLAGTPGAYALYVSGESMEPRYHAGELIYIHPRRPILPGSYVVVQFWKDEAHGMPAAWVKQFVRRNEKVTIFRQFNPKKELPIPTKRILTVHKVVGSGEL